MANKLKINDELSLLGKLDGDFEKVMPMKTLYSIIYEKQIYYISSLLCHITARKVRTQYNMYSLIPCNVAGQSIKTPHTCMVCFHKGWKNYLTYTMFEK